MLLAGLVVLLAGRMFTVVAGCLCFLCRSRRKHPAAPARIIVFITVFVHIAGCHVVRLIAAIFVLALVVLVDIFAVIFAVVLVPFIFFAGLVFAVASVMVILIPVLVPLMVVSLFWLRNEWVDEAGAQRDQVRTHSPGKPKVELQRVVHGVELAIAQEIEVLAVRIKGGCKIVQHRARDRNGLADRRFPLDRLAVRRVGYAYEPHFGRAQRGGKPICQPAAVGRPVEAGNRPPLAAIEYCQRAVLQVYH